MKNFINKEYFSPIIQEYMERYQEVRNCGYWQMPFVPYTLPEYSTMPLKVFFVGRDTYYWREYDEKYVGHPELYAEDNAAYVTIEKIREDFGKEGRFWDMVAKVQLQMQTGVYHKSLDELTETDWKLLEGIAYGNLFSIELPQTLKKKKSEMEEKSEYDDIHDRKSYRKLRQTARPFETLKTIFSAYGEPDIVFVLAWTDNDFLEGLDYEKQDEFYEDGIMDVYLSKTHKTKVVWTSHPRRFSFLRKNVETLCRKLCDTANILLK